MYPAHLARSTRRREMTALASHTRTPQHRNPQTWPPWLKAPEVKTKIAQAILARMVNGEGLKTICRTPGMPPPSTVRIWALTNPEFGRAFHEARRIGCEGMADELVEISDDGKNDWMERLGEDGKPVGWKLNGEHVLRSRLRVDTRKWVLSKVLPKLYGDKLQIGGDPENPIKHLIEDASAKMRHLTEPELEALARFAQARLAASEAVATYSESEDEIGDGEEIT